MFRLERLTYRVVVEHRSVGWVRPFGRHRIYRQEGWSVLEKEIEPLCNKCMCVRCLKVEG